MNSVILDGAAAAKSIRAELAVKCSEIRASLKIQPRLDVILVGGDPASVTYVNMKKKACIAAGMLSEIHELPTNVSQHQVLELVNSLNCNADIHGILVQHPVPEHLNEQEILDAVAIEKDVDGISALSLGKLITAEHGFRPCTPKGILRLLDIYEVPIKGKNAVVVGRSIILGKPAALLLLERHATVTICHSRTLELPDICRNADILVAALGKPEFIKGDWVKPGACVIDAGYHKVDGRDRGVGDVDYEGALQNAAWITPVPGSVGPMTIAMLLENTVYAAQMQYSGKSS